MAMSGIALSDDVKDLYKEMQKKKTCKIKYAAFCLNADTTVVIIDTDFKSATRDPKDKPTTREQDKVIFDEMRDKLNDDKPRYIVYDFGFNSTSDGRRHDKLAFISWCSDVCPVKLKLPFAATRDSVLKSFQGIAKDFQISDKEEFNYDEMSNAIEKAR